MAKETTMTCDVCGEVITPKERCEVIRLNNHTVSGPLKSVLELKLIHSKQDVCEPCLRKEALLRLGMSLEEIDAADAKARTQEQRRKAEEAKAAYRESTRVRSRYDMETCLPANDTLTCWDLGAGTGWRPSG